MFAPGISEQSDNLKLYRNQNVSVKVRPVLFDKGPVLRSEELRRVVVDVQQSDGQWDGIPQTPRVRGLHGQLVLPPCLVVQLSCHCHGASLVVDGKPVGQLILTAS